MVSYRSLAAILMTATTAAAGLSACAAGHHASARPHRVTDARHGLSYELPAGWFRARRSLTPHLVDPREVLSAATYPLRYRQTSCAQVPGSALEDLPRDGAFLTIEERGRGSADGFPARPAHFGPQEGGNADFRGCVPRARFNDSWFTFGDGGRHFHVDVAFGPQATRATRAQAWAILDSLRVDPSKRPRWRSSP